MKKFLAICKGLKDTDRLRYRVVRDYFSYLQYPINKNKYFPVELVDFPEQIVPHSVLSFNL